MMIASLTRVLSHFTAASPREIAFAKPALAEAATST